MPQALKEQEDELVRVEYERDQRRATVSTLEQQLAEAKAAAWTSENGVRLSQKARVEAERALRKARDRVTQAEEELGRLHNP